MVCDLQRVRYDSKYLNRPGYFISQRQLWEYRPIPGWYMGLFFLSHQCTDMCRSLGIVDKRPDMSQIDWFMNSDFGRLVQIATTYFPKEKFDESLPPQMKQTIRDVLMKTFRSFRPHYLR